VCVCHRLACSVVMAIVILPRSASIEALRDMRKALKQVHELNKEVKLSECQGDRALCHTRRPLTSSHAPPIAPPADWQMTIGTGKRHLLCGARAGLGHEWYSRLRGEEVRQPVGSRPRSQQPLQRLSQQLRLRCFQDRVSTRVACRCRASFTGRGRPCMDSGGCMRLRTTTPPPPCHPNPQAAAQAPRAPPPRLRSAAGEKGLHLGASMVRRACRGQGAAHSTLLTWRGPPGRECRPVSRAGSPIHRRACRSSRPATAARA
jgi:hypothetical protein